MIEIKKKGISFYLTFFFDSFSRSSVLIWNFITNHFGNITEDVNLRTKQEFLLVLLELCEEVLDDTL